MMAKLCNESFKSTDCCLKLFLFNGEFLIVVHIVFYFTVGDHFFDFQAHILEKLMDVEISFKDENAPSICGRMFLH